MAAVAPIWAAPPRAQANQNVAPNAGRAPGVSCRATITNRPETSRCVASVIITVPGSATACTRAAILVTSP